jgi:hypothetical protein
MFNPAKFTLPEPTAQFFSSGVEVGSDAHKLVSKFSSLRYLPGRKNVMFARAKGVQITILLNGAKEAYDLAVYDAESKEEFEQRVKDGDAIFTMIPIDQRCDIFGSHAFGFVVIDALKRANLWDSL